MAFFDILARLLSFFGPYISLALIMWGIVVAHRVVVPALFAHHWKTRWGFHFLVVFLGCEIIVHFVCAVVYSCRLGVCPAECSDHANEEAPALNGVPRLSHHPQVPQLQAFTHSKVCGRLRSAFRKAFRKAPPVATAASLNGIAAYIQYTDHLSAEERRVGLLEPPRRHCEVCRRLKAPREHHCSTCGLCVPKMDHHCVFIDNCVDVINQRYFLSMMLWVLVGCTFELSLFGYGYTQFSRNRMRIDERLDSFIQWPSKNLLDAFAREYTRFGEDGKQLQCRSVVQLMALTTFLIFSVLFFLYKHIPMLLTNITSIESIILSNKQSLFASTSFSCANPYDLGWISNILEVYGRPHHPLALCSPALSRRVVAWAARILLSPSDVRQRTVLPTHVPSALAKMRRTTRLTALFLVLLLVPILDDGVTYDGVGYPTVLQPGLLEERVELIPQASSAELCHESGSG